MASKFLRRQKWWVKLRHPVTGESIRESLETGDPARAELLRQRLDLEVALLDPRFGAAEIPQRLREALSLRSSDSPLLLSEAQAPSPHPRSASIVSVPHKRVRVDEAITAYGR